MAEAWTERTDKIVARFTKDILDVAIDAKLDFEPAGHGESRGKEIANVLRIDTDVVNALLAKKG